MSPRRSIKRTLRSRFVFGNARVADEEGSIVRNLHLQKIGMRMGRTLLHQRPAEIGTNGEGAGCSRIDARFWQRHLMVGSGIAARGQAGLDQAIPEFWHIDV